MKRAKNRSVRRRVMLDTATWTAAGGSVGPFRHVLLYRERGPDEPGPIVDGVKQAEVLGYWECEPTAVADGLDAHFDHEHGVLVIE
jgi:hypothetical protein